ncbi:FG-GAP-like repeat-containing protein [Bacteroidota bacterium]
MFVADTDNRLYSNNGDGSFTKITTGVVVNDGYGTIGTWGDYDNDGDLDLFVAGNPALYQNNGDGTFINVTSGDLYNSGISSGGCNWVDYDNDGDLDLFVANGENIITNILYRNDGELGFVQITSGDIVNDLAFSAGGSWGDYNNDGFLDLFVANGFDSDQSNFLYRNNGDGTFVKITSGDIVNDGGCSYGSSWGDMDNDGDLDLFVTNNCDDNGQNNFLYSNNGDATFTKITTGGIVNDNNFSLGCAWADYDNDGNLDLFVAVDNGTNNLLYRNDGNSNNWINIKCVGTVSNTSAIGAKLRVKANIFGNDVWQMRELSGQTGAGLGSQNSLNAEFGLGDATVIDSIIIEWPSDSVDIYTNVPVRQFAVVTENQDIDFINLFPVATNDNVSTPEDTSVIIDVLVNDTDINGDTLMVQSIDTTGTIGTVGIDPGNTTITYMPEANFNGNDTFIYTISDGKGGKDTATVVVTVTPVNDAPSSFELLSPIDDVTIDSTTITFIWQQSIDIELDDITYIFNISGAGKDTTISDLTDTVMTFLGNNFFQSDTVYFWHTKATDGIDSTASLTQYQLFTAQIFIVVDETSQKPDKFILNQNYPNPFNSETYIEFNVIENLPVSLKIYDVQGREVATLINEQLSPAHYKVSFNGRGLESGIYYYYIRMGEHHAVEKMILIR